MLKSNNMKLSVVLATKNEEKNISDCLESVRKLADEIVIFDEKSTDNTTQIAQKYGAKVTVFVHKTNFHETKQKAIDEARGDWVLQLDADERVTEKLANEIRNILKASNNDLLLRVIRHPEPVVRVEGYDNKKTKLFLRHQQLIEKREGKLGKAVGEVVAFFIPRSNFFLGKPLKHAGLYPDGVIRLFKRGFARLPGKSVHEIMEVDGEVGWLYNDLEHHDSPTLERYLDRMNRYTDLQAVEIRVRKVPANYLFLLLYTTYYPLYAFLKLYVRHLGFLDGTRGFLWSVLSALHYPIAYFKYYQSMKK